MRAPPFVAHQHPPASNRLVSRQWVRRPVPCGTPVPPRLHLVVAALPHRSSARCLILPTLLPTDTSGQPNVRLQRRSCRGPVFFATGMPAPACQLVQQICGSVGLADGHIASYSTADGSACRCFCFCFIPTGSTVNSPVNEGWSGIQIADHPHLRGDGGWATRTERQRQYVGPRTPSPPPLLTVPAWRLAYIDGQSQLHCHA